MKRELDCEGKGIEAIVEQESITHEGTQHEHGHPSLAEALTDATRE